MLVPATGVARVGRERSASAEDRHMLAGRSYGDGCHPAARASPQRIEMLTRTKKRTVCLCECKKFHIYGVR